MAIAPPTQMEKDLMDKFKMGAGDTDFAKALNGTVAYLAGKSIVGTFDLARTRDMLDRASEEQSIDAKLKAYGQVFQMVQQPAMWSIGIGRDSNAGLEEAMYGGQRVWQQYMKD